MNFLNKTGLIRHNFGDADWHTQQAQGLQNFEDRTGLSSNGNPQGVVMGNWYGQTCYDTLNQIFYECVQPGSDAASTIWRGRSTDETGTFKTFLRKVLPAGWLLCDGTTHKRSDYPGLYAAMPDTYKSEFNFTLPNLMLGDTLAGFGNTEWGVDGSNTTQPNGWHEHVGSYATVNRDHIPPLTVSANLRTVESGGGSSNILGAPLTSSFAEGDTYPNVKVEWDGEHTHSFAARRIHLLPGVKF
jgi:hypothetical protein